MAGFQHSIAGGQGNLIAAFVQSPNFQHLVQGWQIARDGSAEFNNLVLRGTFNGTNFIINSSGAFFYSGTPAAGNLIYSITAGATSDGLGNAIPNPGSTSYFNSGSGYISLNVNGGALSWATAATEAGPWTTQGEAGINIGAPATLLLNFNTTQVVNMVVTGSLTVNGSTSTGAGSNGGTTSGPSGTVSSFPAAGPNHTHAEFHTHPL